jgi:16S rRNA (uracil1498-N3)-methyltransferase
MRKVRAPIADLSPGERTLDPATGHYLARVLRLGQGDPFVAFDPKRGVEADATIAPAVGDAVLVRIGPLRDAGVRAEVTWIHGMAKGDKLDAIVRDATELGATRIVIAATSRAVVKLAAERGAARAARWERVAREAARQAGRADAPRVEGPLPWGDALASVDESSARFVLWENADAPLGPPLVAALSSGRAIAFAAGPEGGLSEDEARLAESKGWMLASLGALVLRTETVPAAVLGAARVLGT